LGLLSAQARSLTAKQEVFPHKREVFPHKQEVFLHKREVLLPVEETILFFRLSNYIEGILQLKFIGLAFKWNVGFAFLRK
jgi:hypothetical protein